MTTLTTERAGLTAIVNTDRYPLDRSDNSQLTDTITQAQRDLAAVGCAKLPGFIRPDTFDALTRETEHVAPRAYRVTQEITPYSDHGEGDWPADHPRRRTGTMTNGFVGRDLIPDQTMIKSLYEHDGFKRFIGACLSLDQIHRFADPIRGLVVNVMDDGKQMPWHFDANEFIVSLMTKQPQGGGVFEYCPDLRRPGDECYDDVRRVLDGDRGPVQTLELAVGDLQIFKGRYAMHRVTPSRGERHTVLFGFSESPSYIGGVESTRIGYGRVTQAHLDAEKGHVDGLAG